ncbi:MAG: NADAR family protein [Patescibacteria group bacterium]
MKNVLDTRYVSMKGYENPISHFAPIPVVWHDGKFHTSEHACRAAPFINVAPKVFEKIRNAQTPIESIEIADMYKHIIPPSWHQRKRRVVMEISLAKLEQHKEVRNALLASGDLPIVLDTSNRYWGAGRNGRGLNVAGKIMEFLRDELIRNRYPLSQEERFVEESN